jgi:hypothetical protein
VNKNILEVRLLGTFEVKCRKKVSRALHNHCLPISFSVRGFLAYVKNWRVYYGPTPWKKLQDNLHHALWQIRKALPPKPATEYLRADDLSIAFNPSVEYWRMRPHHNRQQLG